MFHIGQKVVCLHTFLGISINIPGASSYGDTPIKGKVYTISSMWESCGKLGLGLSELHPQDYWYAEKFKPLQEEKGEAFIEDFIELPILRHKAPQPEGCGNES